MTTPPSDHDIATTMHLLGGSFAKALADAWFAADPHNQAKIQDHWRDEWEHYRELAILHNQRKQAGK